ncbi:MAG TPA: PHB depolymerase family esterase [Albitalea sp.]|nr:PHB depolymerase family esterase [Albitalea sp.]
MVPDSPSPGGAGAPLGERWRELWSRWRRALGGDQPRPPGRFSAGTFSHRAGTRAYKLFVPGGRATPRPLLVMLHGCRQDPDDFAAGTRMNELAQAQGWLVLYPGQSREANTLGCWNWFVPAHQERDRGEPAIIADLTREIARTHDADPRHIYVAGLSAGGAMAAILASAYPDLYAAAGVHSGVPRAVAKDLASALRAMRQGPAPSAWPRPRRDDADLVPTIVFHGDEDTTVHPRNGAELVEQARWTSLEGSSSASSRQLHIERSSVPAGRAFTRTVHRDAQGRVDAEHWVVHGSGHAWSGGSPAGSFTDPLGPDASREMLRFFAAHPRRETGLS